MKLKKIKFHNDRVLNDLEVNFCNENGNPENTIVIIGENGAGKTTLLKNIFDTFYVNESGYEELNNLEIKLNIGKGNLIVQVEENEVNMLNPDVTHILGDDKNNPKVVYMPTEINFEKINKVDNTFQFTADFLNIIDQNMTQNIPSLIATKINREVFRNRNKLIGEVIDAVCEDINSIFSCMDLDVKLIGLSETYETKPIFKNSLGNEFDINGLSSGEKQLFLRALALKFLEVNNSIILIDEPEISLHPKWQRKIIKVYENIGHNNQLIIATHSPHIVGDIKSKQLRIIKREKNGVTVIDSRNLSETYGKNIGDILSLTMDLESLRNEDISNKLNKVYALLGKDLYETDEFKNTFDYLKQHLGDLDKDIMRINLEKTIRIKKNVKGN